MLELLPQKGINIYKQLRSTALWDPSYYWVVHCHSIEQFMGLSYGCNLTTNFNPIHTEGGPYGPPEYIFTFLAPLWSKMSAYTFPKYTQGPF